MMFVKVIVEINAKAVDKMFIYSVPSIFINKIAIGARVSVPFGNRTLEGFVLEMCDNIDTTYKVRDIISVVDENPLLNHEMIELGNLISKKILCSRISIYQAMLPRALKASYKTNIKKKFDKYLLLNENTDLVFNYLSKCRYLRQKEIIEELLKHEQIKIDKIDSSIKTLIKNNICKIEQREVYRYSYTTNEEDNRVILNEEQKNVVNRVTSSLGKSITFLLYGVTASGKTEVYMNIIEKVVISGKSAIMLVPEISLTPQITERFIRRFGNNVAILHSGLSDKEKYDEYRKILNKEVNIVVGARSAIFAPLSSLGVIIIDEEHTSTYKQDNNPRYHARDVAIMRSKYHNCPVVLGSATPSLESMARAGNHVYELLTLKKRANGCELPFVSIVDMKDEIKTGSGIISNVLDQKIRSCLEKDEQVILFLNRRGYSSVCSCMACGEVIKCPNCDISLTYHKTSEMLRCHYCGYAIKKYNTCLKCGANKIREYGLGTQKLEEEIKNKYSARIVRMDMDTTSKKGEHKKIIDDFGKHKYDILIGTQMIAKGLDFPLVTLVGVINADSSLNVPDFRSAERTFQLLCQVSGRAGRSERLGEVVIQTFNPKHYSIVLSKKHDYLNFYKEEMKIRKQLSYSPYYYIVLVKIVSKDYDTSFIEAKRVGEYLRSNLKDNAIVLGPAMARVFRINNVYYQQCIIKYQKCNNLENVLFKIDQYYRGNNKVNIEIDIDPIRV